MNLFSHEKGFAWLEHGGSIPAGALQIVGRPVPARRAFCLTRGRDRERRLIMGHPEDLGDVITDHRAFRRRHQQPLRDLPPKPLHLDPAVLSKEREVRRVRTDGVRRYVCANGHPLPVRRADADLIAEDLHDA
jgi:hypothetical protein